jgi:hypothetical protein
VLDRLAARLLADVRLEHADAPGHGVRGAVTIPPPPRKRKAGPNANP